MLRLRCVSRLSIDSRERGRTAGVETGVMAGFTLFAVRRRMLAVGPGGLARQLVHDSDLHAESGVAEPWASLGDE